MTNPRLVNLIVCTDLKTTPRLELYDVRRRWRNPPESFWVVADIDNPKKLPFSWQIEVLHRNKVLDATVETLEPISPGQFFMPELLSLDRAKPLQYSLRWLLNCAPAATIRLDFGHPEADP